MAGSAVTASTVKRPELSNESKVRPDRLTLIAFAGVILVGGGNAIAIRLSNNELAPLWGAGLRFVVASAIFFVIMMIMRLPVPKGWALLGILVFGLLGGTLGVGLFYLGLKEVSAGMGQIVIALAPLFTFFLAQAHGQERFRWRGLVGAVLALAGILVAFGGQLSTSLALWSLLALVGAAACYAEINVIGKMIPGAHPISMNAFALGIGGVGLLVWSLLAGEKQTLPSSTATWAALTYLVIVGSVVMFALYLFVLQRWTASATSFQYVLFPFVTIAAAAPLLGEPVTWPLVVGGALVLVGVVVGALTSDK